MTWFSRVDDELSFTGPLPLVPVWRAYGWFCTRWVSHDCDRQPITCRLEFLLRYGCAFDRWTEVEVA